jgi:prophage maintenance system killer protein
MIPLKEVLQIHEKLILLYGGLNGIRDISGLEAALARHFKHLQKKNCIHLLLKKRLPLVKVLS